jgi:glucose-6-phosphate isomerase
MIQPVGQWGVELGTVLANRILPEIESGTEPTQARLLHQSADLLLSSCRRTG